MSKDDPKKGPASKGAAKGKPKASAKAAFKAAPKKGSKGTPKTAPKKPVKKAAKPMPVKAAKPIPEPVATAAPIQTSAAYEEPAEESAASELPPAQASGPPAKLGLGGCLVLLAIIAVVAFFVMRGGDTAPAEEAAPDVCENTCESTGDGECDDGGEGSDFDVCAYGTDCDDCGPRPALAEEEAGEETE